MSEEGVVLLGLRKEWCCYVLLCLGVIVLGLKG